MKIDLHGYELSDAIVEISYAIRELDLKNDHVIEIVHGFHSGQVLKNYIRSKKFLQDMKKDGYFLKALSGNNPGSSFFLVTMNR
ncbi:Smr/MutS family protein [Candidatus Harpocratesius sp.]